MDRPPDGGAVAAASGGPLGVARGPEFAAFEAIESTVRGKEAVSSVVFGDNACGSVLDFNDVGLGHVCSLTGSIRCSCLVDDRDLSRTGRSATDAGGRGKTAQRHAHTRIPGR